MSENIKDQIRELKKEDQRLNNIIINLTEDIRKYKLEIQKQKEIIRIQNEIIDSYKQLADMNSAEWWIGDKFVGNI